MAWIVARKDLREARRDSQLLTPMLAVPFGLCVFLPAAGILLPWAMELQGTSLGFVGVMLERAPAHLREAVAGLSHRDALTYALVTHYLLPVYLCIPMMATNVIAIDAIAGERERGTLEALMSMPLRPIEVLAGKLLASWVPAVALSLLAFVAYCVVVDALAWRRFQRLLVPDARWAVAALLLAPSIAAAGLAGTVAISARVRGTRHAQAWSGLLALPLFGLIGLQAAGAVWLTPLHLAGVAVLLFLVAGYVLASVARRLGRERLGAFATGNGP